LVAISDGSRTPPLVNATGFLCHKADPLWVIGRITRCYSEPDRDELAAVTDACTAGQPPHTLQLTD